MKNIKWKTAKGGKLMEHILEGFVDGKLAFMIEGKLCVTDLREMKASHKTSNFITAKHYRLDSNSNNVRVEAKVIAYDLLNGLNIDIHKANYEKWKEEDMKTAKLLEDAEKFLNSLKL